LINTVPSIVQIFIFLILGYIVKRKGILSHSEISVVKKLVIDFSLPALLFLSFARIEFSLHLIPVTVSIIALCIGLAAVGKAFSLLLGDGYRLLPVFNTTMNFGLLGIMLYQAMFGLDKLEHYSIFGIGHELFMWFLFFPFVGILFQGRKIQLTEVLRLMLRTPIMWGIIAGCIVGFSGIYQDLASNVVTFSLLFSLEVLSEITMPLLLLFIGYSVEFIPRHLKSSMVYITVRIASFFIFGYLLKVSIIDRFVAESMHYDAAYFLLMLLPPVYVLPLILEDYVDHDELVKLNNAVVLHSLITIAGFIIYSIYLLQ